MKLVLFDIDGTLVAQPGSELRFFHYLRRRRAVRVQGYLAAIFFTLLCFPRYGHHVMRKNKAWLSGLRKEDVARYAEQFVHDELAQHLIGDSVRRLHRHRQAGDCVVLLSGTPQFIADPLARYLGAEFAVAARCADNGEYFLARPPLRHPLGRSKITAARQIAECCGLPMAQATAYGDSWSDSLLFSEVEQSIAIRPDRRLRQLAQRKGWEIVVS